MRRSLLSVVALLLAVPVWAADEYVNPVFCYRIAQPRQASRIAPIVGGNGVVMEVGSSCGTNACARLAVSAANRHDQGALEGQLYFRLRGWKLDGSSHHAVNGVGWRAYRLSRNDERLKVYEYTNPRDQAKYVVSAQYAAVVSRDAERATSEVLASWRWISACR